MSTSVSFDTFPQKIVHIAKRGSAALGLKIYQGVNALHEILVGSPAPGAGILTYHPHDHAGHGGVPIPRNNIYSFDSMNDVWQITLTGHSTWYRADHGDNNITCPDTSPPNAAGIANISAYVTEGINSSDASVTGIEAKVLVKASTTSTKYFRFYNRTTKSYSTTQTIGSTSLTWVSFTDIPCLGGEWNAFDLEVKEHNTPGTNVKIYSLVLSETRPNSQPGGAGSNNYPT